MPSTANYSWTTPTVGGSTGTWGTILNTLFTAIDSQVYSNETVADAAMPKAGGTFTGEIKNLTDIYTIANASDFSSALDLNAANFFYGTCTGSQAISFSNVPSTGSAVFIVIEITNGGLGISFPGSVNWPGGSTPTFTSSGVDIVTLYTRDGGTTWYGLPNLDMS
jgi:hypothetical protein